LRPGNPQCGFEFMKTPRACSGSMQNAPLRCHLVNSEEAVRRLSTVRDGMELMIGPRSSRTWRRRWRGHDA